MAVQLHNTVKARLASGEVCNILAVRHSRTVDIVGIAQASGHDAFYVDLQHSTITEDQAVQMCQVGLALGVTPLVRVPGLVHATAEHLLEGGALGIIVPDVREAADAVEVASWCKYPPKGVRSPLNASPLTRYVAPNQQADREAIERETIVFVMLENEAGIDRAEEIAAVPGVDVLLIGSSDLTSSMGMYGQFEDPRLKQLYKRAIAAARKHGKHLMIGGIRDARIAAQYVAMGAARCFITGTDTALLLAGAAAQVERFKAIGEGG
jgi:2-keto-3-deoxy-L-rhamnonate aldolase RhmA